MNPSFFICNGTMEVELNSPKKTVNFTIFFDASEQTLLSFILNGKVTQKVVASMRYLENEGLIDDRTTWYINTKIINNHKYEQ